MTPLVSILIPAYNAQEWIADTIRSALAQTWPKKEIIVVDDGSTDQTFAVAKRFASKNVSVITKNNEGAAATRNKAFTLSQGDFIQWLDSDDLLASDKIMKQMKAAECYPNQRTLFSSGWAYFLYRPHKAKFIPSPLWCDLSSAEWLLRKVDQNLHMPNSTWLVSRQLSEASGPWDTRLSFDDDGEYFCRVLLASDGVVFIPGTQVYYRRSGFSSLSNVDRSDKRLESLCLSMKLHVAYLRSLEDSKRVREACLDYLQRWLIYFYPDRLDLANELQQLASNLGGKLARPRLSWKYEWMRRTLGWNVARHAQTYLPRLKWLAVRSWDKAMFRLLEAD